jgi:tRNA G18 (ribose-2'-O)-methylase SpoU
MSAFFAIGIEHTKTHQNVGTLWRSAHLFGAAFMFTVGRRYRRQPSDTMKSWRSIPLFNFDSIDDLIAHLPYDCRLVGVELAEKAVPIERYPHPKRCAYLLGAEDNGLTAEALRRVHNLVRLPGERSMNVAAAGTVVLYDRSLKSGAAAQ